MCFIELLVVVLTLATLLPPYLFVCLFVGKITRKLMSGFQLNLQEMLIIGQGIDD